ncbi:MAG TPA: hypothetical protein VGJ93_12530, partial [Desulfuromonadaceae bacterium]
LSVQAASTPQKLRPNAGIGILLLSISSGADGEKPEPLFLYQEPAISRLGELNGGTIPPYDWIFGMSSSTVPLIVTARKGNWLKVVCDDAGREAWLILQRQGAFHTWESFFKGKVGRLLTGVRKQYCQLFIQPGKGASTVLNPKKSFKIIKIEDDWALVMLPDQNTLSWLRWRDEDGRLLIGLERLILLKHT